MFRIRFSITAQFAVVNGSAVLNRESGRKLLATSIDYYMLAAAGELFTGSAFRGERILPDRVECGLSAHRLSSIPFRLAERERS